MTKRYDEPIEVTSDPGQGGAPLAFEWRGRRYEVDQWLATWREAGEWWRRNGSSQVGSSDGGSPHKGSSQVGSSDGGSPHKGSSEEGLPQEGSRGVREHEYFRVLARPSGAMASGDLDADGFMCHPGAVYDLYRDRVQRHWRLARVWD